MAWLFDKDRVENWAFAEKIFTPEECKKIIEFANKKGTKVKASVVGNNNKNEYHPETRKNKVVWLQSNDDLGWAYERMATVAMDANKNFFGFDLYGFCEDIQFTEYGPKGDHYVLHMDKILYGMSRKLSMVVQLTDPKDYKGGDLEIHIGGEPIVVTKQQGMITFFPSYIMHRVTPVTKGMRHTLVAWIAGTNFR
jgi:PKHD-type hydroxylase